MKTTAYLCIKKTGSKWSPRAALRLTKSSPALATNEIAMRLELDIPDQLFDRPFLQGSITIPKDAVSAPVIDASIVDNVQEVIKQQTGVEVRLNVISPSEEQAPTSDE